MSIIVHINSGISIEKHLKNMLMPIAHIRGFMEFGAEHEDIKKSQALLINNCFMFKS